MADTNNLTAENTTYSKASNLVRHEPLPTEMSLVDILVESPIAATEQLAPNAAAEQLPSVDWTTAHGLVWLTGSVLAVAFFNKGISETTETYRKLLEKDVYSKSAQVVDQISTIGNFGVIVGLACGVAVGFIWAFHKAKREGCLSKLLFRGGMATTAFSILLRLTCMLVMIGVFNATK